MKFVRDLMLTAAKCDRVQQGVTIREAILALKHSQDRPHTGKNTLDHGTWHGVWLVLNDDNLVVGKLSPTDIVMNMDPIYRSQQGPKAIAHTATAGLSPALLKSLTEHSSSWSESFGHACQNVLNLKVKDCMRPPRSNECALESETQEEAIHKLAAGRLHSLLVTSGEKFVGILRLTDVFQQLPLVCVDHEHLNVESCQHGD